MPTREYIESRCIPIPFAGCWMWMLSFGSHGYGNASTPSARVVCAHRLSYEVYKGPIPDGMLIQHSCDNKWCVNPDHLSLGTDRTNSDDKHRKGRANLESRKFNPRRMLTRDQALEVLSSAERNCDIARRLGVSKSIVFNIRNGRSYRSFTRGEP